MAPKRLMQRSCIIERTPDVLYSEIDGEVVILSVKNEEYYYLNSIGSAIWHILETPCKMEKILSALLSNYDINEEKCLEDTASYLQDLYDIGLIAIHNE